MQKITLLGKIRIGFIYLWAILVVLLVPNFFFSLNGRLVEKVGKKIPIREGTFQDQRGSLQMSEPAAK